MRLLSTVLVLVTTASGTFAQAATSPVTVDFRCLNDGQKGGSRLEWRLFSEVASQWSSAYVKYKGAKQVIPLVKGKTVVEDKPEGRPWAYEVTWLEVFDGKITGEYRVSSQGANINDFVYKNYATGKEHSFQQDLEATADDRCVWK